MIKGSKVEIYVIPNGITSPIKPEVIPKFTRSDIKFLYLGAISKKKGFGTILQNLTKIVEEGYLNWHLNVIGEWVHANEKKQFTDFIQNNKLNDKIIFYGKKIGIEKWEMITQNNFLIHLTEYDSQPLTILKPWRLGFLQFQLKLGLFRDDRPWYQWIFNK